VRRLFWVVVGVGLGAVAGVATVRWVSKTKQKYSPPNMARSAGGALSSLGDRLKDAIAAGAEEMVVREAELRTELNLPPQ
jgi:hypothetical protein